MKAVLHETNLDCYAMCFEQEKMIELSGESVITDKMPDIGLLGETAVHIILRGKRTENGIGTLEGDVQATVCYIPDSGEVLQSFEIAIPWEVQFESDRIVGGCTAIGDVSVSQIETRMLNPRKVLVRVQVQVKLSAYVKQRMTICDDMEESELLQVRKQSLSCSVIGTVTEKTFVATDEYPLSAEFVGGKVLCKSVRFRVDDIKSLANKLIVKGSVLSDVVVVSKEGNAERVSFTSGFSMIAETDCEAVSSDARVNLAPTGLFYEVSADGKNISVEAHGVCQMLSYKKQEMAYISDAYSNFYECQTEHKTMTVWSDSKTSVHREIVTISISGKSQISAVRFATVQLCTPINKGNAVQIPMMVTICISYDNGTRDWLKKTHTLEWKLKGSEALLAVRIADIYTVVNGSETELRISLDMDIREDRESQLQYICSVEIDEEHPYCRALPCLSVVRRHGDLWGIARDFGSTVKLIQEYNQLDEEELGEEILLVIPKQCM